MPPPRHPREAIKTRGESVAVALGLIGARPVCEATGRVARYVARRQARVCPGRSDGMGRCMEDHGFGVMLIGRLYRKFNDVQCTRKFNGHL